MALTYKIEEPSEGFCKVIFTNDEPSITHVRYIRAEFDEDGMYLSDPTLDIVRQLSSGIESKINKGVITQSNNIILSGPPPFIEEEEE